ncbi:MAG: NAD(P)H-binding protein, partial [Myxococcales bacterium]|nr:NAD(P)H-binding protein [Myxococcales bacterium]
MSTAIIVGATGLVGAQILSLLLADAKVERVVSLGRRKTGAAHEKLEEHAVDLGEPSSFRSLVKGDFLFSALGTTLKKAGSKEAQRMVDVTYPLNVATVAAENGVKGYGLVSAVGADAGSVMFYNRIKGELERDVQALGFERVRIARPSILTGERNESRPMEELGISALGALR